MVCPAVAVYVLTFLEAKEVTTPVKAEPLPTNDVAVTVPLILTLPVPVIFLELRSKLPPSCGVVSSKTLEIPPPPPPPPVIVTLVIPVILPLESTTI